MGYSYIHYEKLINDNVYDKNELEKMRKNNIEILEKLKDIQQNGKKELLELLEN